MSNGLSRIVSLLQKARRGLEECIGSSTSLTLYRRTSERVDTALRRSYISRIANRTESAARSSWLYRWLTTEPDPDVIVIDLRETWTVGPVLAGLDRVFTPLAPKWADARSRKFAEQFAAALESQPVRVLSFVALVAITINLIGQFALGSLGRTDLGIGLIGASLALIGTQIAMSWNDVTDSRTFALLAALLAPPAVER